MKKRIRLLAAVSNTAYQSLPIYCSVSHSTSSDSNLSFFFIEWRNFYSQLRR